MALYEETKKIQQELNDKFGSDDPIKTLFSQIKLQNQGTTPPIDLESTKIYMPKDSRNYARFFGEAYSPIPNLEDVAAGRQSGWERMGYMVPRIGVKVASEIAQLPGYLGGALAWGATGFDRDNINFLVDNFWQKAIQSAEESIKGKLPVYTSDKVKEGNLLENIFSTSFWANEGADGVGFLLAFLAPGQALKATKFGAKAARLIKPGTQIAPTISKGKDMALAVDAATRSLANNIDFVGATVVNTLFESAAEGGETFRNVMDKTNDKDKAAIAAVDVVKKNFGILLLSNAVDQYWLFKDINLLKRAGDPAEKVVKNNVLKSLIDPKTGKPLTEAVKRSGWDKAGTYTKTWLEGIGKEGFYEEGMQYAASKHAEELAEDPTLADRNFLEEMVDLGETYIDSLSDTDMQKSIFLGGLLGGGMSTIHTLRQDAATKRLLEGSAEKKPSAFAQFFGAKEQKDTPGLRKLLQNGWDSRYVSMADLAEKTTKDGNVISVLNDDGTYKLDPKKVESLAEGKLLDYAEKEKLVHLARTGNEEGFKLIKEKVDHRYMSLFLQQDGGLQILLKHIDALAEADKENFEKEGITYDLEEVKKDLKAKAIKFQAMYDRVNNTHDLLMDDVKATKEQRAELEEYSNLVKNNKLNSELRIGFYDGRINSLRKSLSETEFNGKALPISSTEDNLSKKLITDLKEAHSKVKGQLSDASNKQIDRVLSDLEKHQEELIGSRETSSKLYSSKFLNDTFKEFTDKKAANKDSVVDGNKAKEALSLGPKMKALFDKAIIYEQITAPSLMAARHSGELEISYRDRDGKIHKAYGTIKGANRNGNLDMNIHKAEVTNKETGRTTLQNIEDKQNHFLNEDETFNYQGQSYEVVNIRITKSPEEIQKERRSEAFISALKEVLKAKQAKILGTHTEKVDKKGFNEQISDQQEYIDSLKIKLEQLTEKELNSLTKLTKQGQSRKQLVKIRVEASKNLSKKFLTANELKNEIIKAKEYLAKLQSNKKSIVEDKKKITDLIKQAKESGDFIASLNKLSNEYDEFINTNEDFLNKYTEINDDNELYLKRLHSTLEGYVTTFARVLGLQKEFQIIAGNRNLTDEQVKDAMLGVIAARLSSGYITEDQYEQLGLIPEHLETVKARIVQTTQLLEDNKKLIVSTQIKVNELNKILALYKMVNRQFNASYKEYLKDSGVLEDIVDDETKKGGTPEGNPRFIDWELDDIKKGDKDYKHVFYDENSWFISSGNQMDLVNGVKNDDLSRWYIFVNKLAYERTESGASKYVLRSYTLDQIGELKEDHALRKRVKFYAGTIKGETQLVTFDQLKNLPKENQDIAKNDIKMVVFERSGKPLIVTKQVFGDEKDTQYPIYNSFIEHKEGPQKFDRFSIERAIKLYITDKKWKEPTNDQEKDEQDRIAREAVEKKLQDSWKKYLENREKLKEKSHVFEISQVNPGVKVFDDTVAPIDVLDAAGTDDIKDIAKSFVIHIAGTRKEDNITGTRLYYRNKISRKLSWTYHDLLSGYLYFQHDNRFERVRPNTFGETGSVEDIINIIKYLSTNPKEADEIEKYLHKILYINASNKNYKIGFTKFYGANKVKTGFRSLFFDGHELTIDQILNEEGLDLLRDFIAKKYWNFDEKTLKENTFTEYKVSWSGKKPKITSKLWDNKDGGYVGFLFSKKDGNIPKGRVFVKPQSKDHIENTKNPQYLNQSVSLVSVGTEFKQAPPAKSGKNKGLSGLGKKTEKTEESGEKKKGIGSLSSGKAGASVKLGRKGVQQESKDEESDTEANTLLKLGKRSSVVISPGTGGSKFQNENEYWNSLGKAKQDEIVSKFPNKTETELKAQYFRIYQMSINDSGINRWAEEADEYVKEEFDSKLEWFRNKFPQIPISVIESQLLNGSWGRLTRFGKVLISDLAAEGTIYHEAYHTYSLLFLSEEDRKKLYSELEKRLGRSLTDKQAEEILAEEFREYMLAPNSYNFGKSESAKKSWFKQLLDYILELLQDWGILKTDKADFYIESTFKNINEVDSFVIEDQLLKERAANLREDYNRNRVITDFTEKETLFAVQDFNYAFFQIIFDPQNTETDLLFDINAKLPEVYRDLEIWYDIQSKKNEFYKKMLSHFDELKERHREFLKNYQIFISETALKNEEEIFENADISEDDKGKNSTEYMDSVSVDLNKLLDNPIRMVIAGLPSVTMHNNNTKLTLSEFSTRSTAKYSDIVNVLSDQLATVTSMSDMVYKLFDISKDYPEMQVLLKRMGIKSLEANNPTVYQMNLQNQFYKNFSRTRTKPKLLNYTHDGRKYDIDAVEHNTRSIIQESWIINARELANDKASYIYKSTTGEYLIKVKTLKNDLAYFMSLKNQELDKIANGIDILSKLGINLKNRINADQIKAYLKWLNDHIKDTKEKISLNDLYNDQVIKNQQEMRQLIDTVSKAYLNNKDLSYFNQDGNREYSITLNSHLSNVTNLLNTIGYSNITKKNIIPEEVKHLMAYDPETEEGSLFNTNSIWLEQILSGEKLELVLLKGLTSMVNGVEISKAVLGDYKAITANALLNGVVPFLRSADRKLEYGFKIGTVNYEITDAIFKQVMYKYLEDELRTSFALFIDSKNWGGNLNYYSKNAKSLRVFKFLEDNNRINSLEDYYADHKDVDYEFSTEKTNKQTVQQANKLAKQFIKSFNKNIDKSFDDYIKDLQDMTKASLMEDNLIREEGTGKGQKYFVPAFGTEILEKIGISEKSGRTISPYNMDKIIRIMTYNSFVGNNEQLKLFLGDLAHFKNSVDFHKRTTGATSTKYNQRDDVEIRQHLDEFYRRFDNRQRNNSMSMVVVDDIITSNSDLKNYFEEYNNINGVDAQSWMMLDEYRDVMLRHGIWYPRHERTYQFEMQKLALRLIKLHGDGRALPLDINRIKSEFQAETGMFYKHTGGKIPTTPMYLKSELNELSLTPLTIIKPQGFGRISNYSGLAPTQFWKTSAAPVFMSAISEDSPMFDFLLKMIGKGQGLFTFKSSMKQAEIIGDNSGKIQELYGTDDYISQDFKYRDFGIQLDIHEETEGEVSVSTQRTRLEFLDIFNLGEPVKNDKLAANRHEYTYLTNELEVQLRGELLDELGILYDQKTGTYKLHPDKKDQFKNKLISAFQNRQLPLNVIDGLELSLDNDNIEMRIFDVTLSKFKIEEVLTSIVRNKLIKRKTSGEMLIQESALLYENPNSAERLLEFYQRTFPNGKKMPAVITPMDVMIALPKSLIEFTKDIGGLDALNSALDEYYKTGSSGIVLPEDLIKSLVMPANRIPGQSISSLDIIRVRKFLPPYHGNKIVIPAEATVKTGSDFDVDKLTTYFNKFTYENKKLTYHNDLTTISGKQNRLNELAAESLLDPERFKEFLTPINTKYLKDRAKEIKQNKDNSDIIESRSGESRLSDVISWWYNMQKGHEFWVSKSGVAVVAVQNAAHAIEQNHPLELNNIIPLMFEGQELNPGEKYISGFIKDSSGRYISHNFAEFLSAFVDAVKDPFIFEITNTDTFNSIAALNRFGRTSSVGIDSIIEFYSQKVVKDFLKVKRANSAQYMTYNQYNTPGVKWTQTRRLSRDKQYQEVLRKLKVELNPSKEAILPISYNNSVAAIIEDYIDLHSKTFKETLSEVNEREDLTERQKYELTTDMVNNNPVILKIKSDIQDRIKERGYKYLSLDDLKKVKNRKGVSNDELFKLQVQILDNFMMYNSLGWNVVSANSYLRPDAASSFNSHLNSIDASVIVGENTIKERGIIDFESVLYAIAGTKDNPSLIREFFETKQNTPEYFRWSSLIQKNKVVRDFFNAEIYPTFANPNKRLKSKKIEAALETIESDFITFLSVGMLDLNTEETQNHYKSIFSGKTSVANRLLKLQKDLPNNMAIQELQPLIEQKNSRTQAISELDNISLFSKKFDSNQWDALEADIFDLAVNGNKKLENFVKSLILLSNFQSGYKKSPISIHEVIPNRLFIPMISGALNKFSELTEAEQKDKLYLFLEQMYRNNSGNSDIVTRNKFPVKYGTLIIHDNKGYHKHANYIAANIFIGESEKGSKTPMAVGLYKRISPTEFQIVSKLGDDFRFKEYYLDAALEDLETLSIVESNKTYEFDLKKAKQKAVDNERDYDPYMEDIETEDDADIVESKANVYFQKPTKKSVKKSNKLGSEESDLNDTYILEEVNKYAKFFANNSDVTIHQILRMIEGNTENDYKLALAKILREELKMVVPVTIYDTAYRNRNTAPNNKKYNGFYAYYDTEPKKRFIGLYENLDESGFELTALHEGLHALTTNRYETNGKFRTKIDNLNEYVKSHVNSTNVLEDLELDLDIEELNEIVFSDPKEFISYGLSNIGFQKLLSAIPALDINNVNPDISKSIFKQFLETIYELFEGFFNSNPGIKEDFTFSAFHELVSVVDTVLKLPVQKDIDYLADFSSSYEIAKYQQNYSIASKTQEDNRSNNKFELAKEGTNNSSTSNIEISNSLYTRDSVMKDSNTMYLFTDNNKRTSNPGAKEENVDKDGWYYQKYKSTTNRPIHFGTLQNPTSAVIRGLNNAYPISTMSDYGTNWNSSNFELFKSTIDDEITQIKKDLPKFDKLKIGNYRIGQGGRFAKLPEQHQKYLDSKLLEIGINNSGNNPKIIDMNDEFSKLYPDYSYLSENEREAFQEAVNKGVIKLACRL